MTNKNLAHTFASSRLRFPHATSMIVASVTLTLWFMLNTAFAYLLYKTTGSDSKVGIVALKLVCPSCTAVSREHGSGGWVRILFKKTSRWHIIDKGSSRRKNGEAFKYFGTIDGFLEVQTSEAAFLQAFLSFPFLLLRAMMSFISHPLLLFFFFFPFIFDCSAFHRAPFLLRSANANQDRQGRKIEKEELRTAKQTISMKVWQHVVNIWRAELFWLGAISFVCFLLVWVMLVSRY